MLNEHRNKSDDCHCPVIIGKMMRAKNGLGILDRLLTSGQVVFEVIGHRTIKANRRIAFHLQRARESHFDHSDTATECSCRLESFDLVQAARSVEYLQLARILRPPVWA